MRKLQAALRRKYAVDRDGTLAVNFASLAWIPRRHAVALGGQWYDARSLADWHATTGEWTNPRTARPLEDLDEHRAAGVAEGLGLAHAHRGVTSAVVQQAFAEVMLITHGHSWDKPVRLARPAPGWTIQPHGRASKTFRTAEGWVEAKLTPVEAMIRVVRDRRTVMVARAMIGAGRWTVELRDQRLREPVQDSIRRFFDDARIEWTAA